MIINVKHNGNVITTFDDTFSFFEKFNTENGRYVRSGIISNKNEDVIETQEDPFMRSIMNLIDIGVAGSCKNGKLGICLKSGVQCYQSGNTISKPDMTIDDYKSIIDQVKGAVFQVALGGRGDPNLCEHFQFYCEYARENGIIPNYTTSGINLSDEQVEITKNTVGACAVSWYRNEHTLSAIEQFVNANCITNIHYVLGNNSIDEAIERLQTNGFPQGINAVIFLTHKPVGLGQSKNVLKANDAKVKRFFEIVDNWNGSFKIGFDSCAIPGIINYTHNIDWQSLDTCEGARFSAYITSDMIMTPCSFDQDLRYGVNLHENSIQAAWNSSQFQAFRDKLTYGCNSCSLHSVCKSGCPLKPEIVLCDRIEKK